MKAFHAQALGTASVVALAAVIGSGQPVFAAEVQADRSGDENPPALEPLLGRRARPDMSPRLFAQFQLPSDASGQKPSTAQLQKYLPYQYFIGIDPEVVYRDNADLDNRLKDKSITWLPSMSGIFTYRPSAWLETTLELQAEKEFVVHEENPLTLPNGTVETSAPRHTSFLIDQFHFTIKEFTAPFEISVGRKGFEDERRSLLDTSMDAVSALIRNGRFTGLALIGRETRWNWDVSRRTIQERTPTNTFYGYGDYRLSEDVKLAGYGILRSDRRGQALEGSPTTVGLRAFGTPSAELNYWIDAAYQGGTDEVGKQIRARAYDLGLTRRFFDLPLSPNFTVGWAMGSGDDNPDDAVSHRFKPTGLGSNERRFAGIRQFKAYGETLDPDLSNVKILTVGFGIRPDPQVSIDLIWHGYRLHRHGTFESGITAEPSQVDSHLRKDLGTEWDLALQFNNLLGVRRLKLDLRLGWFRPGQAYIQNDGTDANPILRFPDRALSGLVILQW